MTTYMHRAEANIAADALFGFLTEPRNLPRDVLGMTAVEPEGGDARIRSDKSERLLEWAVTGTDDYHGELRVEEVAPVRSRITVYLHSMRDVAPDEVRIGLERMVAALIRAVMAVAPR